MLFMQFATGDERVFTPCATSLCSVLLEHDQAAGVMDDPTGEDAR